MARQNLTEVGRAPQTQHRLRLSVLRRERPTPGFARVTLGGSQTADFVWLGFDQWGRLFLPSENGSLERVPDTLDLKSWIRMQAARPDSRPVMRNVSICAYREDGPEGPELDLELAVHEHGRASQWAQHCSPGDEVIFLDMGLGFAPPAEARNFHLVCDETGFPALASILASLPADSTGRADIEVSSSADQRALDKPAAIEVTWHVRPGGERPGALVTRAVTSGPVNDAPFHGWVAGEQLLASTVRRHWVAGGVPKSDVSFCGYWKTTS